MLSFVDTNVFGHYFEGSDADMQAKANQLLTLLRIADTVISTQVLVEFGNVMRRYRVPVQDIELGLRQLTRYNVRTHESDMILRANLLCAKHQLSWFDALIVQSALDAGCGQLFSQDLSAGQQFSGSKGVLTVINPFA